MFSLNGLFDLIQTNLLRDYLNSLSLLSYFLQKSQYEKRDSSNNIWFVLKLPKKITLIFLLICAQVQPNFLINKFYRHLCPKQFVILTRDIYIFPHTTQKRKKKICPNPSWIFYPLTSTKSTTTLNKLPLVGYHSGFYVGKYVL